jgi:DNA-binding winged helix-turn-helix (wHTH) protein
MQGSRRWRIGPFEVDSREHRLTRGDRPIPVTKKAFALLVTLLGRPGQLFTKAELFDTVWAGSVVTDAALSRAIRELRVALGDDAASPRYVATAHGLGFRFIAPVTVQSLESPRDAQPPVGESRLVGRERDLAVLGHVLDEARAGRRQVVFVTGEAGIGKTALVTAFVEERARAGGLWTASGRCIEQYGTSEAYLPVLEALEQLAKQVGSEAFADVLARFAPSWLAQLPWLARTEAGLALGETTPQRMLREIAQALEVLATTRPIVLWLEDLHWSDPSSLAVVSFLAGRRDPSRLLVIASFRPHEAPFGDSPLDGLALRLVQRGQAEELALSLLDVAAVRRYLILRFGDGSTGMPIDDLARFVHRRTDGNALFTVAMVDDLVRRQALRKEDDGWVMTTSVGDLGDRLPDSLRLLVSEQVERLPRDDHRLIEAAAAVGTDFSAVAVAAALAADAADTEDRCALLARQGRFIRAEDAVVWPDGTVSAGFAFLHALYWQGIYDRVPQGRRAEWQRRIGLRQEQAYGSQCAPIAAELAMRFEAARDAARSLRYLQIAGAAALSRCAYPECIEVLRRGLELVARMPAEQRPRLELDLLLPLGAALMAVQGYASDEVEATYRRALDLCASCDAPGDLERVLRGLWNVAFLRADLARATDTANLLLRQSDERGDAGLAFDAHTKLGQTRLHLGDCVAARLHLERALSSSDGVDGDDRRRGLPRVAAYLAWTLWYLGFPAQARERGEEALAVARQAASPHSSAFALGYVGWVHMQRGEVVQGLDLARQLATLSAEYGLIYWRQMAEFTQGWAAVREGDAALGITSMRRAIVAMRATGAQVGIPYLLCELARAELAGGHAAEARVALADATTLADANGNLLYGAEALRLEGEIALRHDDRASERSSPEQSFLSALQLARRQGALAFELRAATSLARLWIDAGETRRAVRLLAPIYARFDEGADTADLMGAKALLDEESLTRR